MAWTFTRLRLIGYPQYLRNVDEEIVHVFNLCAFKTNEIIKNLFNYDRINCKCLLRGRGPTNCFHSGEYDQR